MYRIRMAAIDPKTYLWANICSLMGSDAPSIDAVQQKTKVGRGTIQRIKEGATSVGTDNLVQIAGAFGIEAWQLLTPGLASSPATSRPKTSFADLSSFEAGLLTVIRNGLSEKELTQLTDAVVAAIKTKQSRESTGTAVGEIGVYFALERRNHDVKVDSEQRGVPWEIKHNSDQPSAPKGSPGSKKGSS